MWPTLLFTGAVLLADPGQAPPPDPAPGLAAPMRDTRDATMVSLVGWALGTSFGLLPGVVVSLGAAAGALAMEATVFNAQNQPSLGGAFLVGVLFAWTFIVTAMVVPVLVGSSLAVVVGDVVAAGFFVATASRYRNRHVWGATAALLASVLPCFTLTAACLCPSLASAAFCGSSLYAGSIDVGSPVFFGMFTFLLTPVAVAVVSIFNTLLLRPLVFGLLQASPAGGTDADVLETSP